MAAAEPEQDSLPLLRVVEPEAPGSSEREMLRRILAELEELRSLL